MYYIYLVYGENQVKNARIEKKRTKKVYMIHMFLKS